MTAPAEGRTPRVLERAIAYFDSAAQSDINTSFHEDLARDLRAYLAASASETPAPTAPDTITVTLPDDGSGMNPTCVTLVHVFDPLMGDEKCKCGRVAVRPWAAPPAAPAPSLTVSNQIERLRAIGASNRLSIDDTMVVNDVVRKLELAAPAAPEARLTDDEIDRVWAMAHDHGVVGFRTAYRAALSARPQTRTNVMDGTTDPNATWTPTRTADPLTYPVAPDTNAAAAEDTARLDWMEARHAQAIPCPSFDPDGWDGWNIWDDVTHRDLGDGDTLREAIDAARRSTEEGRK